LEFVLRVDQIHMGGLRVKVHRNPLIRSASLPVSEPEPIFWDQNGAAVYAGKFPVSSDYANRPVLVFVPGLGKSAPYFWDENTLYENAYNSGFRTAFVSFGPQGEKPQDMWKNGELLARQLEDICAYYRVTRVTVIAHSKGGVDTQTAAVHCGAAAQIARIITLSTPHFGSQLADIAYSTAGWGVADIIRAHSPGCYCMQTGFMGAFRDVTDSSAQNTTPIFTFAGNGGADTPSRLQATALVLDRYGENDGIVTVKSAHNPKGQHLGTLRLNHAQMGDGAYIWPNLLRTLGANALGNYALGTSALGNETQEAVVPALAVTPKPAMPTCHETAQIIRGGALQEGVNEGFCVDSTAESFTAHLLVAGATHPPRFTLIAPDGHKTSFSTKRYGNGNILYATIDKPQIGKWRLSAGKSEGAYTALIFLCGKSTFYISPKDASPNRVGAELRIIKTRHDGYEIVGEYSVKDITSLPAPPKLEKGVYNLEARFSGELEDGSSYERSLLRPFRPGGSLEAILTPVAPEAARE
jgi:hypothetical protein